MSDNTTSFDATETFSTAHNGQNLPAPHHDRLAERAGKLLDRSDTLIYIAVGASFFLGAFFTLIFSFWSLIVDLTGAFTSSTINPSSIAEVIIQFISDLLLVIIITEVLGTVIHYLKAHETSLRPFLFIGIISATRGVLLVGAKLSTGNVKGVEFTNAMLEMGVSAAVVLALGFTLKLLGKMADHVED